MGKKCIKCGYERVHTDVAPESECPNCGVIYAKIESRASANLYQDEQLSDEERIKLIKAKVAIDAQSRQISNARDNNGGSADFRNINRSSPMVNTVSTKQLLGVIGSILLFVGVFSPLVSMPIVGSMNYFHNGEGDGVFVLVLSAISFVLVLTRRYKGLWFTGFASLGFMLFTFFNFHSHMSHAKADLESKLAGNPFRGFADVAVQSVQLQWGWALLITGAALIIASAALKDTA